MHICGATVNEFIILVTDCFHPWRRLAGCCFNIPSCCIVDNSVIHRVQCTRNQPISKLQLSLALSHFIPRFGSLLDILLQLLPQKYDFFVLIAHHSHSIPEAQTMTSEKLNFHVVILMTVGFGTVPFPAQLCVYTVVTNPQSWTRYRKSVPRQGKRKRKANYKPFVRTANVILWMRSNSTNVHHRQFVALLHWRWLHNSSSESHTLLGAHAFPKLSKYCKYTNSS